MTPYHADPWLTVYQGDCREVMAAMEPESVHCVVTSPPYWGLRDYGVDGALGLEPTPEEYVANMVDVFRAVRRVLRADGTVWLNLGDSYSSGFGEAGSLNEHWGNAVGQRKQEHASHRAPFKGLPPKNLVGIPWRVAFALQADGWYLRSDIIWAKPNPMPESVTDRPTKAHEYLFLLSKSPRYYYDADAVREPLEPSSIERGKYGWSGKTGNALAMGATPSGGGFNRLKTTGETMDALYNPAGRNLRSVWSIATQPYPGAHFATFPEALVEPCVKAGTSEKGVCPECGAPWVRVVDRTPTQPGVTGGTSYAGASDSATDVAGDRQRLKMRGGGFGGGTSQTTDWQPKCTHRKGTYDQAGKVSAGAYPDGVSASGQRDRGRHFAGRQLADDGAVVPHLRGHWRGSGRDEATPADVALDPVPATVLDPFAGSGTTGRVAQRLGRRAVLIDLSGEYLTQAMTRNADIPLGLETA